MEISVENCSLELYRRLTGRTKEQDLKRYEETYRELVELETLGDEDTPPWCHIDGVENEFDFSFSPEARKQFEEELRPVYERLKEELLNG